MMIAIMIMMIGTVIMMSANTFVRLRKLNTESSAVTYWLSRYLVKIGQMWRNYSVPYFNMKLSKMQNCISAN